jgi:ketosteroid isomerase-like protein
VKQKNHYSYFDSATPSIGLNPNILDAAQLLYLTNLQSAVLYIKTMSENFENTLKVGRQAFEQLIDSLGTGDWKLFLDMLTDDFSFWFPIGQYHGLHVGKETAKEFFEYVTEVFGNSIKLNSIERVTSNETTIVFEFRDEGMMWGQQYKNRIAVSFDVRGDKICGYREYLGSDGKSN